MKKCTQLHPITALEVAPFDPVPSRFGHAFAPPPESNDWDKYPRQEDLDFDIQSSLDVAAEQNELGEYADQLLAVAGVPAGMVPGQTLQWTNAANTSANFARATVEIDAGKLWFEFRLTYQTGRKCLLRSGFDGEVMGLMDSAGMSGGTILSVLCAEVALNFCKATKELMITH